MKIVRFLSVEGQENFGVIEGEGSHWARLINGDILGDFTAGNQVVEIKQLLAPVQPPNILALGLNYKKHADETGIKYPEIPVMFLKGTNTVIGAGEAIRLPKAGAQEVDFEAELAVVIKKQVKNIGVEDALDCVLGYTCANDISARDWQIRKQKKQWARGKSFDTFCPLGPWIIPVAEIGEANNLKIETEINGQIYQESNTGDMIFDVPTIISDLSQSCTLLPGTVILTGTPQGVGFTREPPVFLQAGDRVTVRIQRIGELSNPVEMEG
jgi:2-keto-4-pentenoate hydratase/2-oxohepta-3-ene-1,7-dioic acid hydratase in catechol pathway